jgi:hypothetical protein
MRALLLICLLCAGCSTSKPTTVYYVDSFAIVVLDKDSLYPRRGACDLKNRIVYVQYDELSETKPRLETLGHEVWHLVKGKWHE